LPIAGTTSYTDAAVRLILGADSPAIKEKRYAGVQTISGTGANHTGALFLSKFYNKSKKCYISNPTWGNVYCLMESKSIYNSSSSSLL
jgi:aspartate aminotransferase